VKTIEKYYYFLLELEALIKKGQKVTFGKFSIDDRIRGVLIESKIIKPEKCTKKYLWITNQPTPDMAEDVYRELRKKRMRKHYLQIVRRKIERKDEFGGFF
jgi:hypothetical protein